MKKCSKTLFLTSLLALSSSTQADEFERALRFSSDVYPILRDNCLRCHGAPYKTTRGRIKNPKGGLRLDTPEHIMNGYEDDEGWPVAVIAPYSPQDSTLYTLTILPEDHDDIMPSSGDPLTNEETEIIRKWIQGGADFGVFNSPKYVNPKSKEAAEAAAKASE